MIFTAWPALGDGIVECKMSRAEAQSRREEKKTREEKTHPRTPSFSRCFIEIEIGIEIESNRIESNGIETSHP
jgi:hypothetical protein